MPEYTLKELKEFLLQQKYSFYNNKRLLYEIKAFSWPSHIEKLTRINTKKNSKYSTCQIFYQMRGKREKIETNDFPPVLQQKVSFSKEHIPSNRPTFNYNNVKNYPKSILIKRVQKEEQTSLKKSKVYVVQLEEKEDRGAVFRYMPVKKNILEELENK